MNRIIRSNAVAISSCFVKLEINVCPNYNLTPEVVSICGGNITSLAAGIPQRSQNNHSTKAISFQVRTTSKSNYSTSLHKALEKLPSIFCSTVLFGSLAFFTLLVDWIFTARIEKVSQVRERIPSQGFSKVAKFAFPAVEVAAKPNSNKHLLACNLSNRFNPCFLKLFYPQLAAISQTTTVQIAPSDVFFALVMLLPYKLNTERDRLSVIVSIQKSVGFPSNDDLKSQVFSYRLHR